MVVPAGVVVLAAVVGVSVVAGVVSVVDDVTGLSSCGAVDDTAECSSFAGTLGGVSVEVEFRASFLPKILPKIEFLLLGFGAVSRVVEAGVVSATADSTPATGATPEAPAVASPTGTTGSPITRDAISSQVEYIRKGMYRSTNQQQRRQSHRSWQRPLAWPLPSTLASRPSSQPWLRA